MGTEFAKSLPPSQVNDAYQNKEVYNKFHEAFLKHFRPQVRTQEKRARDDLYGNKNYKQRTTESVALYATRFRTLVKDAGGVIDGTDAYLFREGLKAEIRDQVHRLGRPLNTLDECVSAALKAEDIILEQAKSTNQALNYSSQPRDQQGSAGRGGQGGQGAQQGGRGRGRFGGRGRGYQGQQGRVGGPAQGRGGGRAGGRTGQGEDRGTAPNPHVRHDKGRACTHPNHGLHATCVVEDVEDEALPNPPPLAGALGRGQQLCWISTPNDTAVSGLRWYQVPMSDLAPRQA